MKRLSFAFVACSIACAAPEGEMTGTETETETDSSSSGSEGGMSSTMSATSSPTTSATSMTTETGMATTSATNGSATVGSATTDPDSSGTSDSATDPTTDTGECPPGDEGCPCDIGSTCSGDLFCVDGVCQAEAPCDEPEGEPNDDEASAVALDEVTCNVPGSESMSASLSGAESDWFTFHSDETAGCFSEPHVTVTADSDVAVCIFAACDAGTTETNCSMGADESESPDGAEGCCNQNQVGVGVGCPGFPASGDATIWVRVTSVEDACLPYELEWDY